MPDDIELVEPEQVTEEYPIDTSALHKGSHVTVEQLERASGLLRTDKHFWIARMNIRSFIKRRLAERGEFVVLKQVQDGLRILEDPEAARYTDSKFQVRMNQQRIALDEQQSVDRSKLPPDERQEHDRALHVNGRTYQGSIRSRRQALGALLRPASRSTPGLPSGESGETED